MVKRYFKKTLAGGFLMSLFVISCTPSVQETGVTLSSGWKFMKGDSLLYASPDYDDAGWDSILLGRTWEMQGYANYDGYAWYRVSFYLPSAYKDNAVFKDSLHIILGKIDDCDQTFLNGKLVGQNGETVSYDSAAHPGKFEGDRNAYARQRSYVLSVNDPRIWWDKKNVLAVRVHDHGGGGGIYTLPQFVGIKDLRDYLLIDYNRAGLKREGTKYVKKIFVKNNAGFSTIEGQLSISVIDQGQSKNVYTEKNQLQLNPNEEKEIQFSFVTDTRKGIVQYTFKEKKTGRSFTMKEELPYILTPPVAETPRINGPKVLGVRPGSPVLFRIPVTGVRPMEYAVDGLPAGLVLDKEKGIITGTLTKKGEYLMVLKARNAKGEAQRNFKIVVGDKLALTPPLGWNSWNCWGLSVDEEKVRAAADNFVRSGLADHGWTYVNIDDGWEAPERDARGNIRPNEKFKDMKALADYVHSLGLKIGIYSSPGPYTCGHYLGSYQHEEQDARTYAGWGIDYLKYDWCSYSQVVKLDYGMLDWYEKRPAQTNEILKILQAPYQKMYNALKKQKRDIVYSLCQYGWGAVWEWGDKVGGNLWRTTGDIVDTWESVRDIGFRQYVCAPYSKPGGWNDPDMLVVGKVGWGPSLHQTRLTASEQYTHITLWAMLSAPMLIGCDLSSLDDFTLNLLTNDEVLEIDQDPLGKAAIPVVKNNLYEIWVKDLEDGTKAIALFNMMEVEQKIDVDLALVTGSDKEVTLRDVWRQQNIGRYTGKFDTTVMPHGTCLLKIVKE